VGLVLISPPPLDEGTKRQVGRSRCCARRAPGQSAHRFEERQRLDVPDRAADLDDRTRRHLRRAQCNALISSVDMRITLHGAAEVSRRGALFLFTESEILAGV